MNKIMINGICIDVGVRKDLNQDFAVELSNFLHKRQHDFVLTEKSFETWNGDCKNCLSNSYSVLYYSWEEHHEDIEDDFKDFDDFGEFIRIMVCEDCGWWYLDGECYSI